MGGCREPACKRAGDFMSGDPRFGPFFDKHQNRRQRETAHKSTDQTARKPTGCQGKTWCAVGITGHALQGSRT